MASEISKVIKRRTTVSQLNEPEAKKQKQYLDSQNGNSLNQNGTSIEWHSNAGMITRVFMKNFMCHGELDYRPTERLNFVHGANGSGKVDIFL